jgi:hypothetical protein
MAIDTIKSTAVLDGAIATADIADANITTAKIADANITTAKIADDAVTADKLANSINTSIAVGASALPKAGGTMTGVIAGFESTGIDDNATSTAITIDSNENVTIGADDQLNMSGSHNEGGALIHLKGTDTPAAGKNLGALNFGNSTDASLAMIRGLSTASDAADMLFFTEPSGGSIEERMRINSVGNVGIGTSSPAQLLEVKGGSNTSLRLHSDTDSSSVPAIEMMRGANDTFGADAYTDWRMKVQGGNLAIESADNGATTDRMQIDYNGKVGINQAPAASWQMAIKSTIDGNGVLQLERSTNADSTFRSHVLFTRGGSQVGEIKTNHNSTQYNTTSDYRLKENVTPMSGATAQIKLLKPCNFDWKTVGGNVNGFLAHELAEVVPEAVSGTKDAMRDETDEEGNVTSVPDLQGIDQSKLVPLLVKTIQELEARITALEDA